MTDGRETLPERDERTIVIENASYRLGYLVTVYALLVSVMYRSFYRNDAGWDLLGIVIGSGMVVTLSQARHHILGRGWLRLALLTMAAAAVVAILVAFLTRRG